MRARRDFLRAAAGLAFASPFHANVLAKATSPKKRRLGVALVGLGYYATDVLAPALQKTQLCRLAGIVTGTPSKIPIWKARYELADQNIYSYENIGQIANNDDIDVIYIVLPPSMHKEYVIKAAETGKHVWCEKPMAMSVSECEAMITACEKNKVSLAIGYRCQHDPNTQAFQSLAQQQTFGKVQSIVSTAGYIENRSNHWKQQKALGGGVMYDLGVYAIQGALLASGREPIGVSAHFYTQRPHIYHQVEETALFQIEFEDGGLASCTASFSMNTNHLHADCERGTFRMEPFWSYQGNRGSSSRGIINFPLESQQVKQMDDDAQSIINGAAMLVSGQKGLADIKLVEAVYQSVTTGKYVKV